MSNPVFLPNAELRTLFQELKEDFLEQLSVILSPEFLEEADVQFSITESDFSAAFDAHVHRYQQIFLYLQDYDLLKNALLDIHFMTIIAEPGRKLGDVVPVIRQQDDSLFVGFEALEITVPPVNNARDFISVASIPMLDDDVYPYEGKSCLVTSTHAETEVILVTNKPSNNRLMLIWGDSVIHAHGGFAPPLMN